MSVNEERAPLLANAAAPPPKVAFAVNPPLVRGGQPSPRRLAVERWYVLAVVSLLAFLQGAIW